MPEECMDFWASNITLGILKSVKHEAQFLLRDQWHFLHGHLFTKYYQMQIHEINLLLPTFKLDYSVSNTASQLIFLQVCFQGIFEDAVHLWNTNKKCLP